MTDITHNGLYCKTIYCGCNKVCIAMLLRVCACCGFMRDEQSHAKAGSVLTMLRKYHFMLSQYKLFDHLKSHNLRFKSKRCVSFKYLCAHPAPIFILNEQPPPISGKVSVYINIRHSVFKMR